MDGHDSVLYNLILTTKYRITISKKTALVTFHFPHVLTSGYEGKGLDRVDRSRSLWLYFLLSWAKAWWSDEHKHTQEIQLKITHVQFGQNNPDLLLHSQDIYR